MVTEYKLSTSRPAHSYLHYSIYIIILDDIIMEGMAENSDLLISRSNCQTFSHHKFIQSETLQP